MTEFSTGARELERRFLASAPALASGPMTAGDVTYEFIPRLNPDGVVRTNNGQFSTKIEDQGPVGSCTGFGTSRILEAIVRRAYPAAAPTELSQLLIYWNARKRGGLLGQGDTGAVIRDALDAVRVDGACLESEWPYVPAFYDVEPSASALASAATRTGCRFERIRIDKEDYPGTIRRLKSALMEGQVLLGSRIRRVIFRVAGPFDTHVDQLNTWGDPYLEEDVGGHCWVLRDNDETIYPSGSGSGLVDSSWTETFGWKGTIAIPWVTLVRDSMEAWLVRDFMGYSIGPAPEVPLTPERVLELRADLKRMGLDPAKIVTPPPGYDDEFLTLQCSGFGLLRAEGCTITQIATVVNKPAADIAAFAAHPVHQPRIAAWAAKLA